MHNAWGQALTTPLEIVRSGKARKVIESGLRGVFAELQLGDDRLAAFEKAIARPQEYASNDDFERQLSSLVASRVPHALLREKLDRRADTIVSQITPHLIGNSLLDVGCGDGMVSWRVHDRFSSVQLVDVINYVDPRVSLPFRSFAEGEPLPVDNQFDTSLIVTVLHHSSDPVSLLKNVIRATRRRIIIIESVYGFTQSTADGFPISRDEQLAYAIFFDWLYNRVLHDGVPVPYNFTTPDEWRALFSRCGMKIAFEQSLGVDIRLVPEYHYLFVVEPIADK